MHSAPAGIAASYARGRKAGARKARDGAGLQGVTGEVVLERGSLLVVDLLTGDEVGEKAAVCNELVV